MLRKIVFALMGTVTLSAAVVPVSQAQTEPPEAASPAAPDISGIDTETRRAFAVAYLDVAAIAQASQQRLAAAQESPEEQQRVMEDVTAQMAKAIDETPGISVEEYSALAQAAQSDAELREEIGSYVNELVGSE